MTDKLNELSLSDILERLNFKSIETVLMGTGWVGTRYIIHTYNYGSSYPCESMDELKQYIITNYGKYL